MIVLRYLKMLVLLIVQVVLLVHGLQQDSSNWGPEGLAANLVDPLVADGFRVVTPDLRGHGKSDKPPLKTDYGMHVMDDVIKLLDSLSINKVRYQFIRHHL